MHLLLGAINCLSFCRLLKWNSLLALQSCSLHRSRCTYHLALVIWLHITKLVIQSTVVHRRRRNKTNLIAFHTSCNIQQNHTHTSTVEQSMPRIPELNRTKLLRSNNHALMRTLLSHRERELYDYRNSECDFDFDELKLSSVAPRMELEFSE